jgi:hypothetical protein
VGPLGELGALFNPGMRHEIEERKSKANRREEEGNARDGDFRIDLASGVAVINVPGRTGDESKDPVAQPAVAAPANTDNARQLPTEATNKVAATADTAEDARPSTSRSAPRESRSPARDSGPQKNASSRSAARASRAAAAAEQPKVTGKSEAPRPAPRPSSKASRAAR